MFKPDKEEFNPFKSATQLIDYINGENGPQNNQYTEALYRALEALHTVREYWVP